MPQEVIIEELSYPVAAGRAMKMEPQFEEETLFEYHLYTLDGTTTVRDREQKQMTLLSANQAPVVKKFVYDGAQPYSFLPAWMLRRHSSSSAESKVRIIVEVANAKPNLGIPLPKGIVRLFKADKRGALQFVGEDEIDHTPKDETLRLYVGDAFDLVGEFKRVELKTLSKRLTEETFEVMLRNHRDTPATVDVIAHVFGDWEVVSRTHAYTRKDSQTLIFPVSVPTGGETLVRYTVRTKT
jgi:hypothetical protein